MAVNHLITSNAYQELIQGLTASHMKYLVEDEYSSEIKYRRALEEYIREFVNYGCRENKFSFSITSEVLRKNVASEHFNALKAAEAWSALSTYAKNLYNQPWRPEFREIKLYSGFYKHQIESHLNNAEAILELMGYRCAGNRLILDERIHKRDLCQVSLDTLKAMCECQILFSIYEELAKHVSNITYADILKYRETYGGSEDEVIRGILCRTSASCCIDCHADSSLRGYRPNYGTDVCDYPQSCITTANGYVMNFRDQIPYQFSNGRCDCVRTAKLIDLDDSHEPDCHSSRHNRKAIMDPPVSGEYCSRFSDQLLQNSRNSTFDDKSSRKHDTRKGDGSRDSAYKLSDKENAKNKPHHQLSNQSRHHSRSNGVSEALNNISLRPNPERSDKSGDRTVDGRKPSVKKLNFLELNKMNASKKVDRSQTWACNICTFINSKSKDVCEMCGKSKNVTEEEPLESGGKHCSRCTLVNKKEALKCEACNENLENSPTYV